MCAIFSGYKEDINLLTSNLVKYFDRSNGRSTVEIFYYKERKRSESTFDNVANAIIYLNTVANMKSEFYIIFHTQAATSKDKKKYHPARITKDGFTTRLYMNGIILQSEVKRLQEKFNTEEKFDTALLLRETETPNTLGEIKGSFACILTVSTKKEPNNTVLFFRNNNAPLYFKNFCLSSIPLDDGDEVTAGRVYEIDIPNKDAYEIEAFRFDIEHHAYI